MKSLWRKNENKNEALLDYRATTIQGIGLSPSQLCMGRRLRTTLPMATGLLKPETYNAQEIKRSFQKAKDKQKYHYDRHGTRELPPLKPGDHVRVKPEHGSKEWKAATVVQSHASPRSYVADTSSSRISRITCRLSAALCKHTPAARTRSRTRHPGHRYSTTASVWGNADKRWKSQVLQILAYSC